VFATIAATRRSLFYRIDAVSTLDRREERTVVTGTSRRLRRFRRNVESVLRINSP